MTVHTLNLPNRSWFGPQLEFDLMPYRVEPMFERVVVKLVDEPAYEGKLIIPESSKDAPQTAEVIATNHESAFNAGDRVIIAKYAGHDVKIDGVDLIILAESDVLARVTST